ncbi:TonB-dependent receptor [Desertivirga arenae]|uniref:TonB-dependent receptor n=1 Tax=Desertivirga arenae TaxID=2810309 RepID=UPI001A96B7C3|nr:TonB-dependent receptor plug domain-containing protein [Pedobacter sp. SYSU D00823]
MKRLYMLFVAMVFAIAAIAQNNIKITLKNAKSAEPLTGATVSIPALNKVSLTDSNGVALFSNIPNGNYKVLYQYIGYTTKDDSLSFPEAENRVVLLNEAEGEELDEVVVSTTRSSRTIANIPTRIEVIAGEELDEKGNMKPGDIRMILNESTGIQTQQTSATSANASIRIQGLDGRYTQILKDGFPLYSGAASGLGLLQTPPLDLKQVEVIKGSASTLYGGGAIAGLVNLVSKTPKEKRELNFHLNGTSAGGLDLNGFYSEKYGKAGLTLFTARNSNRAYAPGNIDLTAIPEFSRYTFNPKLFLFFNGKTTLNFGINSSFEERTGGDLHYIKGDNNPSHSFFEKNKSERVSSQFSLTHKIAAHTELNLRNSISYFNRKITIPTYSFEGNQYGTFTELNIRNSGERSEWIGGLNLWTDQFQEKQETSVPLRNYSQTTFGGFIQNNIHAADWLEVETGLRTDYIVDYGFAVLPRASALIKINDQLNSRIGGGLGYKAPTIFTEESERVQYQNVLPVSSNTNKLETSYGLNWDINYRTAFFHDQLSFSINHLFFYTFLNNPLSLENNGSSQYRFDNLPGHMDSRGMETNVKLSYQDLKLFLGYSLTDAQIHVGNILRQNPLTAKHRLNNVLMYEVEDKWKLGAEAYYYSKQKLSDRTTGKPYWIFGFMAEKLWERFSLYINFENFTDTRQTRFDNIYSGSISNPIFKDIYAPLDGFVVNGGLKLRL